MCMYCVKTTKLLLVKVITIIIYHLYNSAVNLIECRLTKKYIWQFQVYNIERVKKLF